MTAALLAALLAAGPGVEELRAQAQVAYDAKRFPEACRLFGKAVELEPTNGPAWADLAACQRRLGRLDAAIASNHRAISLGDEQTRLNAYFNLRALGVSVSWPTETAGDGQCTQLAAVPACKQRWWVCSGSVSESFTGGAYSQTGVSFGPTAAQARARLPTPSSSSEGPNGAYDLTFSLGQMTFCQRTCEREFTWCTAGGLAVLKPRIDQCLAQRGCTKGRCDAGAGCESAVCAALDEQRGPFSPAEQAFVDAALAKCCQGVENPQSEAFAGCTFVSANPCARAVGMVCRGEAKEVPVAIPPAAAPDAGVRHR